MNLIEGLSIVRFEVNPVLKFIRRNAAAAWVKGIFVAIVVVFVFWGVGTVVQGDKVQAVARINDDVIEPTKFYRAYNNMLRTYQETFGDNFKPEFVKMLNIKTRTVDQLVQASLLEQEAERIGLRTSETELRDAITGMGVFQDDGRFNKERYVAVLRQNNLTPTEFEDSERVQLQVEKLRELILAGIHVNEAEVHDEYRLQNERVDLRFLKFDAARYLPDVTITDEQVQAYYDAHKEEFREPERARIEYVLYATDAFAAKADVTDEDIQKYYDEHQAEYSTPEQARARHILFKVAPNAPPETSAAVRKRAEEVLAKVKAGEDFAALAKQYSEDTSAPQGGDLGAVARGQTVKPFEDAVFALSPGTTSEIIESQFGLHIIKVESKQEAKTQSLAEVRDRVSNSVKQQKGRDAAQALANAAHTKAVGGETLTTVAGADGISVVAPPPFSQMENVEGIGRVAELTTAVFATAAGQLGPVVTSPKGFFVFRVNERIDSKVPELADIRIKVEAAARKLAATALAKTKATEALAEVQKNGIDAAASAHQLTVEDTGPFTRQVTTIPKIGNAPDVSKEAFRLTGEKPVAPDSYTVGDSVYVVVLKERLPADEAKFANEKDSLMRQAEERREAQALQQFIDQLKTRATVEIDQTFVASITETGRPLFDGARP